MNNYTILTRLVLTVVMLILVWLNAHWTVALMLTWLALHAEALTFAYNVHEDDAHVDEPPQRYPFRGPRDLR